MLNEAAVREAIDIANWLRALGLERYEAVFRENDIRAELLPTLTAEDLKDLGVTSVGHRRQLLEAIAALRIDVRANATDSPTPKPQFSLTGHLGSSESSAERRPLSVMFCDLVGSSALSSQLDPEDLRDVIRTYQACVTATLEKFDGFIARYVGDGVLIYFGWPEAGETDAARAVRAGLALVAAISRATLGGEWLQIRIGIATGLVVIGEPIGSGSSRQQTAIGETPNLAARLQGLAEPNQVVIDAATRRQIGGLFGCCDLGAVELKGLPLAVPAWRVVCENRALGQFEALRSSTTPLVGRDEEIELLLRCWRQAKAGAGRVVLVSAEPGVGKSRLAEALAERIAAEPHALLRYFCAPHHQDSALYPVTAQMERAAGLEPADTPATRLMRLQALLSTTAPTTEEMALIAELHGLPPADTSLDTTPQRKKQKVFEALLGHIEGLSRQQPVLMTFDDLHWVDPSSQELLDRLTERVAAWPVLVLAMFRPEFDQTWAGQPHVTTMALARLDRRNTAAMVANVAGSAVLPPEIVSEIADRTDGVPLFVEELTKAVLECGAQASGGLSAVQRPTLSVPATLHASLMARMDRLGPTAKEVAQTGAAIGREFGYGVLASVTDLPEPLLRDGLARLTNAGLLFASGLPPNASYAFKHALVQDAAYVSLLRGRRQRLHACIAATLGEQFREIVTGKPAVLARHYAEAGMAEPAVAHWLKAGQQALAASAMAEAVAQLRKGLNLLDSLPDGPRRQQQELELQTALGSALTATSGWSAANVAETLARGRALAEILERSEYLVPLTVGQWAFHSVRAEHRLALPLGEWLECRGCTQNDTTAQLLGRLMQGATRFYLGDFMVARTLLERSLNLANPAHRPAGLAFDPYPVMLSYLAVTLTYLGFADQARSRMNEALSEARRLRHVHTLAQVLVFANWIDWLTCRPDAHTEEILMLSTAHGFRYYLGWALACRGRSLVGHGQAEEGQVLLTQAFVELRAAGGVMNTALLCTWLAEAHAALGQADEALNCLAEAARFVEATGERVSEAELLYRVRGDLLTAADDPVGAEQDYRQAIAVAGRQNSKLLQLKASVSLARLWRGQGKHSEARDLLGPIYSWFTEGFDEPDLRETKILLDE